MRSNLFVLIFFSKIIFLTSTKVIQISSQVQSSFDQLFNKKYQKNVDIEASDYSYSQSGIIGSYSLINDVIFNKDDSQSSQLKGITISNNTNPIPVPQINNNNVTSLKVVTLIESNATVNTKFSGLILYHNVPIIFTQNELFVIRGKLIQPASNAGIFVNLILREKITGQRFSFGQFISSGNSQFQLFIDFSTVVPGEFYFTLFSGTIGTTQSQLYTVVPFINQQKKSMAKTNAKPQIVNNFSIQVKNNNLIFSWQKNIKIPVSKLIFSQTQYSQINLNNSSIVNQSQLNQSFLIININKTYYLSNYQNSFSVPFADFANFTYQNITVDLFQAYSQTQSLTNRSSNYSDPVTIQFIPTIHQFAESDPKSIQIADLPWKINVGQSLLIKGKALAQLQNQIIIEEPTKTFGLYYFNKNSSSGYIQKGQILNQSIKFSSQGNYILEVNNVGGSAVINRPVYVGQAYPILPDFSDLTLKNNPQAVINGQITNLTQQRQIFLDLINKKRSQFGVKEIYLDSNLNNIAQSYTLDMVTRNFYGHINPQGLGPQQRANALGFNSIVGENLAININFTDAHYRLCRSPAHLRNLVRSSWTRVGFGLSKNAQNYFYIAQQFSTRDMSLYPLTKEQLNGFKDDVIKYILSVNKTIVSQNEKLSSLISQWQNFNSTQQASISLGKYILSKGFNKYSLGNIMVYYEPNFMNNIIGTNYLTPQGTGYSQVGASIAFKNGFLQIFVSYV